MLGHAWRASQLGTWACKWHGRNKGIQCHCPLETHFLEIGCSPAACFLNVGITQLVWLELIKNRMRPVEGPISLRTLAGTDAHRCKGCARSVGLGHGWLKRASHMHVCDVQGSHTAPPMERMIPITCVHVLVGATGGMPRPTIVFV